MGYSPDQKIVEQYLQDLSVPRKANTENETKIQVYLYNQLKKYNVPIKSESFYYFQQPEWRRKIMYYIIMLYTIIDSILFNFGLYLPLIILTGFFWLFSMVFYSKNVTKRPNLGENHKFASKNISVELTSEKNKEFEAKMGCILFCTHYDSISFHRSRRFYNSMNEIVSILVIINIFSAISLSWIIMQMPSPDLIVFTKFVVYTNLSLLFINFLLLALDHEGNDSPGALDNASGCVVLLHLLDVLNETKIKIQWCDMKVIFCGKSEPNLDGPTAYFAMHEKELKKYKDVYVVNIDTINDALSLMNPSVYIYNKQPSQNILTELILHHANQLKIPISNRKMSLFGTRALMMDFLLRRYKVANLIGFDTKHIHSPKDRVEIVPISTLSKVVELLYNLILSLDKRIGDKIESNE